jgi:O-antigen ligase
VRRSFAWIGVVLLTSYLIFIGGAWFGIINPSLRITSVAGAAIGLLAWAFACVTNPAWRPRTQLAPAIAAVLGSLAIATVFSRAPRVSAEYLAYTVVLTALYLLLVRLLGHPFFQRRLVVLFSMFFIVVAAAFLVLVLAHWVDWWRVLGHLEIPPLRPNFEGLTYLNPSAVLTMVALLSVPVLALVDPSSRRGQVTIVGVVAVVAVVAFLTGSRAGWLALALTLAAMTAIGFARPPGRRAVRRATERIRNRRTLALTVLGSVAGLALVVTFLPAIARRLSEGGEDARVQYAIAALRMFEASPIVGTGPGTWVIQRIAFTNEGEIDYYIPHAHNVEVQTLAEQGLVGALAGIILVVAVLRLIAIAVRSDDSRRRWVGWLTLTAVIYFGAHQLLDFYENMPAVLLAAVFPIAYLDGISPENAGARRPTTTVRWSQLRRPAAMVGAAVVALSVGSLLIQEAPALMAQQAQRLADAGDWGAADAPARQAASLDPSIGSYTLVAGLTASRVGDHALATQEFSNVARVDDLPEAWLDLAFEQVTASDLEGARGSLVAAMRLGSQRQSIAVGVVDLATRIGDSDLASRAASILLGAYPLLATDPWWDADPARGAVRDDVVTALSVAGPVDARWQLDLARGDFVQAREQATALADASFRSDVVDAWAGNADAVAALKIACYDEPLRADLLQWCGRVAARNHDAAFEADIETLLAALIPGVPNGAAGVQIVTGDVTGRQIEGSPASIWGTFTYRRPTPQDLIVPEVAHLVSG